MGGYKGLLYGGLCACKLLLTYGLFSSTPYRTAAQRNDWEVCWQSGDCENHMQITDMQHSNVTSSKLADYAAVQLQGTLMCPIWWSLMHAI